MKIHNLKILITFFFILCCSEKDQNENSFEYSDTSYITIEEYKEQSIEDLVILCKVWGFIKYYHPTVREKYDWDIELFKIMKDILKSSSKQKRNSLLAKWIDQLGFIEQCELPILNDSIKVSPDINWINDERMLGQVLVNKLNKIKKACRKMNELDYLEFEINKYPIFKNEKTYKNISYPDTGFRLLSLFRYWNIIQYFYPYKYLIKENWDDILYKFIPEFVNSKDQIEYRLSIMKLNSHIRDSHSIVTDPLIECYLGDKRIAAELTFVEEKALVTNIYAPYTDFSLKVGDIIYSIEGEMVENIINERQNYISASNYPNLLRKIASNLLRTKEDSLSISFIRNDSIMYNTIKSYPISELVIPSPYEKDIPCYQILNNNIAYIYPGSLQKGSIPNNIQTKGIIIDLRCYPSENCVKGYLEIEQLYPEETDFVKFTLGNSNLPGLFSFTNTLKVGKNNVNYYKDKKIILVNDLTQSHAEFMAMKYKCSPNTFIIGNTTAGSDGGVIKFILPGNIEIFMTGAGVYYPDGTETQQIGIIPDIFVAPSIEGIKEGRDEILEKAIDLILIDY